MRPPRVNAEHVSFMEGEHARAAHRWLRSLRRMTAAANASGSAAHAPPDATGSDCARAAEHAAVQPGGKRRRGGTPGAVPSLGPAELATARVLWRTFGGEVPAADALRSSRLPEVLSAMHDTDGDAPCGEETA